MADYRRYFVPGGTYFFTVVTYRRRPVFANGPRVQILRSALAEVQAEMPFTIRAAVVLPDHLHFIWSLPPSDDKYSKRIGLMKVRFTRRLRGEGQLASHLSQSRQKHHESDVWQRRFWEHTIRNECEFESLFDYIHFNPVKHGHTTCPHMWPYSTFHHWVAKGVYDRRWACRCENRQPRPLKLASVKDFVGE